MSEVIYTAKVRPAKRYAVEYRILGSWHRSSDTYHFRLFAKFNANVFASLGHEARVIDTCAGVSA